jgi:hypothetical protein
LLSGHVIFHAMQKPVAALAIRSWFWRPWPAP